MAIGTESTKGYRPDVGNAEAASTKSSEDVRAFVARARERAKEIDVRVRELSTAIRAATERTACFKSARNEDLLAPPIAAAMREELVLHGEELLVAEEHLREQAALFAQARIELAAARARFKLIFDTAPDASVVTDARGTILEANAAAVMLFNVPRHTARRASLIHFVARQDTRSFRLLVKAAREEAAVGPVPVRVRTRGGPVVTMSVSAVGVRDSGDAMMRWTLREPAQRCAAPIALAARASVEAAAKLARGALEDGSLTPVLAEILTHAESASAALATLVDQSSDSSDQR